MLSNINGTLGESSLTVATMGAVGTAVSLFCIMVDFSSLVLH